MKLPQFLRFKPKAPATTQAKGNKPPPGVRKATPARGTGNGLQPPVTGQLREQVPNHNVPKQANTFAAINNQPDYTTSALGDVNASGNTPGGHPNF